MRPRSSRQACASTRRGELPIKPRSAPWPPQSPTWPTRITDAVRQRLRPSRPTVNTTLRVLLVIAIVLSAVQVSALVVALMQADEDTTNALSGFAAEAVVRWWGASVGAPVPGVAG